MPTITILDEQGAELLTSSLSGEGLGKYIKTAAQLRAVLPLTHVLSNSLADGNGGRELHLALEKEVPVGKNAELSISGGADVAIGLHPSGSTIFADSDLQAPVTVPNGTAYSSLTLEALLKAGLAGTTGSVGFGFEAGTALRYAYFHPFDITGRAETVAAAIKTMLSAAVFPADADDLARLPVGALASLAGEGELSFSAQASLSSTTNLLATPGLPIVGSVALVQAASVTVGAEWTASGEFELRVSKPSATQVRLSFYRRRGRSLSVSAKALAGVSAEVRGRDLLAALMKAISPDPEADLLTLVNAGLDDEPIEAIQQAVAASIDRSLTLSAQFQLSALREDEALFSYEVDLSRLDQSGKTALADAMHGRLAAIGQAADAANGPIRLIASAAKQLRERKTSWRINVLGILNVASFVELVREGSVTFDPVSGMLTAADKVSARRIRIKEKPFESDSEKLRKVLFESLMVTAAYQASRALGSTLSLTADQTYLEQRGRTKRSDLEDHYRALMALGLCDAAERDTRLAGDAEFGRSTFVIENHFDAAACDAMFLDTSGQPHGAERYERIARQAFLALIPSDDPSRSYRRFALESDATWAQIRELGSAAIDRALPSHIRDNALRLAVVRGDVLTIVWWAKAMSKAATELAAMRTFLGHRKAETLARDQAFVKARNKLSEALGSVVATTASRFDDPWDVVAMDAAASRLGTVESTIISTRFAARYVETGGTAVAAATGPVSRGARAVRSSGSAAAERTGRSDTEERDFTAEERDVFARHVINLRNGKLSGEGSFSSTSEQVERIFGELIPAYAAAQKANGLIPRVMFYAHGGLVEEREGLLPVLARRRFWELNGVYPVYFVWETGLRETLTDIIGSATRSARAARGPLTDAAIETLARPGGKPVWGQMKKSAENASANGGGARLAAELAGKLWKALKGEIEFHALGHSAGAILHSYFLPVLVSQRPTGVPQVSVRTLHLLAPAVTSDLFKERLKPLIGTGKPITSLATYTMTDDFEQNDDSLKPYGKSLLYLVSGAFEDDVPTKILGLQKSLKQDLQLIRFFGLAGTEKVADIVFSKTSAGVPLTARSEAVRHGGFDNDVTTMTSVVRRVLAVPDTGAVVDYFEEAIEGIDRAAVGAVRSARGISPAEAAPRSTSRVRAGAPAVRASTSRKKWTVMVWMAGDNDLEEFGDSDIAEMKRVGSNDDINVIVQLDRMRDDNTRRYFVRAGARADDDVVEELGETNTGDPVVATDFFRWAIERYPADQLMGVIWNHGAGIDDTDIYRSARGGSVGRGAVAGNTQPQLVRRALSGRHRRALFQSTVAQATHDRAIAFDDTSKDFLDNLELKKVLVDVKRQTGRELDVLGLDACLMSMVEIAYQLRGTARIVVGSEELEPGDGWPYDRILKTLASEPDMSSADLGTAIVEHFVASYRGETITQAAVDLSKLSSVAAAIDTLAKALTKAIKKSPDYTAVTKALNATQRFDTPDFVDLGHFCQELSKRSATKEIKDGAKATIEALTAEGGFVVAERHTGKGVSNANGVAIYFPRGPVNKAYRLLDFAKTNTWRTFLEAYHRA
jgi:Clostripain family